MDERSVSLFNRTVAYWLL